MQEPPRLIFIDTGAFFARYRPSDAFHVVAAAGWASLERHATRCVNSSPVIFESITLLQRIVGSRTAAERARNWLSSRHLHIIRPLPGDELDALAIMTKYADQKLGFVDSLSFVLMRQRGITHVFGFDKHFQTAGFELWPPSGDR